ncbi:hypothetical protein [Streptomyces sp. SID5643]|uniref:hypothetical protein n=1 Tax=Streptomyces sp. SID5643 TaxID=2690307 RepID=UPI001371164C|nr:hypothetical protein [Streptomyces sp. SID5643]MZF85270.1 hypothetical protein [Streptomyces sp. SID5643]
MASSALDRLQELRAHYAGKVERQPWLEYYRRRIADLDERIRRLQTGEHEVAPVAPKKLSTRQRTKNMKELVVIAEQLTAQRKTARRKKIPLRPDVYTYLGPYGEGRIRHWAGRKQV